MEPSGSKLDSSGPNLDCWEAPGSFRWSGGVRQSVLPAQAGRGQTHDSLAEVDKNGVRRPPTDNGQLLDRERRTPESRIAVRLLLGQRACRGRVGCTYPILLQIDRIRYARRVCAPHGRGLPIEPHQAVALRAAAEDLGVPTGELVRKLDEVDAGADVTLSQEEGQALRASFEVLADDPVVHEDEMRRLQRAVADVLD